MFQKTLKFFGKVFYKIGFKSFLKAKRVNKASSSFQAQNNNFAQNKTSSNQNQKPASQENSDPQDQNRGFQWQYENRVLLDRRFKYILHKLHDGLSQQIILQIHQQKHPLHIAYILISPKTNIHHVMEQLRIKKYQLKPFSAEAQKHWHKIYNLKKKHK